MDAHMQEQDNFEKTLRPSTLQEYIGQKDLKQNLSVFIRAAKPVSYTHLRAHET